MLNHARSFARLAAHRAFPRTSFRLIHSWRMHDEIEIKLLPLLVDCHRDAIDVGANVGRYTSPLASLARYVDAFEPHPRLCRILRASLPTNVAVHQIALSDADDHAVLHVPLAAGREDEGIAHLSPPDADEACLDLTVVTRRLDSFAFADVGFLKIDVEGHEDRVLGGARILIDRCRPAVLVECEDRHSPGGVKRLCAFFADRGYDGFFVHERRLHEIAAFSPALQDTEILRRAGPQSARQAIPYVNNFIFLPRDRMPQVFKDRGNTMLAS